eukprot:5277757-Karenia_brevis.AAC.1
MEAKPKSMGTDAQEQFEAMLKKSPLMASMNSDISHTQQQVSDIKGTMTSMQSQQKEGFDKIGSMLASLGNNNQRTGVDAAGPIRSRAADPGL